jgi:regulatory protein
LETLKDLTAKAQHYCAYRERCHSEVKSKLYEWGAHTDLVNETMAKLIEQGYLNEQRFALAYCRGKFIYNHWGKNKILQGLKLKQISPFCIKKGLQSIDETDYLNTLNKLIENYWQKQKGLSEFNRKGKTAKYALQKGYESNLVWDIINNLSSIIIYGSES